MRSSSIILQARARKKQFRGNVDFKRGKAPINGAFTIRAIGGVALGGVALGENLANWCGLYQTEGQTTLRTESHILLASRIRCGCACTCSNRASDECAFTTTSECTNQCTGTSSAADHRQITLVVVLTCERNARTLDRHSLSVDLERG